MYASALPRDVFWDTVYYYYYYYYTTTTTTTTTTTAAATTTTTTTATTTLLIRVLQLLLQVHYRHVWNRYDDLMLMFFSLTFMCWGASAVDVLTNDELKLERPLWSQYDPRLIGELVFAISNLLAIIRLLFFFQITQAIGPLQVSHGNF